MFYRRKRIVLFYLLLMLCGAKVLQAQSGSVKGVLFDSTNNKATANAVVILSDRKDSAMYAFTRSNATGQFHFDKVPIGKYQILVTYPEYADISDTFSLLDAQNKDFGNLNMLKLSQVMQYILVTAHRGAVRVKGDTTEFVADSFKTKAGASVEDLLKKLPGIQVDRTGKVIAQGKEVQKILVDGEEFFGDDPTVATKNLDAKSVDVVQVYDTKSEETKTTGVDDGNNVKVLDIKLKEESKKGYFGNVSAGHDLTNIYEGRAMFNSFTSKRKLSIYGLTLNSPNVGLNWGEKEEFGSGNESEYDPETGYTTTSYTSDDFDYWLNYTEGLPISKEIGTAYNNKFNKDKWKLRSAYNYKDLTLNSKTSNNNTTLLNGKNYFNQSNSAVFNNKTRNAANFNNEWNLDTNTVVKCKLNGKYNTLQTVSDYSNQSFSEGVKINAQSRLVQVFGNSDNVNWSASIRHKYVSKKGRYYNIGIIGDLGESMNRDTITSSNYLYFDSAKQYKLINLKQLKKQNLNNLKQSVSFLYNEPLSKKFEISWLASGMFSTNNTDKNTVNTNNPSEIIDSLSSNAKYKVNHQQVGFIVKYKYKKWNISVQNNLSRVELGQKEVIRNLNYQQSFYNILPSFNLFFKRRTQSAISFSYNLRTNQPYASQIQPLIDNTNPLSLQIGNPNLKQELNHDFRMFVNDGKVLKQRWFYASINGGIKQNAFASKSYIDSFGRTVSQSINLNGNSYVYGYMRYSKEISKTPLSFNISYNPSLRKSTNLVNGSTSITQSYGNSITSEISVDFGELGWFNISYGLNQNTSKNSINSTVNNNRTSNLSADIGFQLPKGFSLNAEMRSNFRQKTALYSGGKNNHIISGEVEKTFFNDKRLIVTLGVYDLLNQNFGYNRQAYGYTISENTFNTFQQFFYGKLKYTFKNKVKAAKTEEPKK